jgi:hypothetical protein
MAPERLMGGSLETLRYLLFWNDDLRGELAFVFESYY